MKGMCVNQGFFGFGVKREEEEGHPRTVVEDNNHMVNEREREQLNDSSGREMRTPLVCIRIQTQWEPYNNISYHE